MPHTPPPPLHFGPYRPPQCRVGRQRRCVIRGKRVVTGMSDAPIQWPIARGVYGSGRPYLIVCGSLVRAIRWESAQALMHWWGVKHHTVWKWRKALGVRWTEGDHRRASKQCRETFDAERLQPTEARELERRAKIAAAKRGKARPPHVIEAMRKGRTGKPHGEAARAKMRAAHARRREQSA